MSYRDRIAVSRPKRLLAIDGGGIRGTLSLEILRSIESTLREQTEAPENFVLADYFDYIGGTSSGAIIASGLASGFPVQRILDLYQSRGEEMFSRSAIRKRYHYKYDANRLKGMLQQVFGADTTFGDERLRTLLMLVMRNATSDSPWPLSNNPFAKYSEAGRPDNNLDLPLWQLVRASTASPTYFPPEVLTVGRRELVMLDGGITTFNNPAFQLFLMATLSVYRLGWPTGEDRLLLVSVGSGTNPHANDDLDPDSMNLLFSAHSVPAALMLASLTQQDALCRIFGRPRYAPFLDRELGDLMDATGVLEPRLFSYVRYNVELNASGLAGLGLTGIDPRNVQLMDSIAHIADLRRVGQAVAASQVRPEHFAGFLDGAPS